MSALTHAFKWHYDHEQKSTQPKCSCGWEFNGVFSGVSPAMDAWFDHAQSFDKENLAKQLKENLAKQLKESAAVREQSRKIIDEFTGPYFRKQNGV